MPGSTPWTPATPVTRPRSSWTRGVAPPRPVAVPPPAPVTATAKLGPGGMPEIQQDHIATITAISPGHPVFLVALDNSPVKLVVKADDAAKSDDGLNFRPMSRQNARAVNDIMTSANAGADALPLTNEEMDALTAFRAPPGDLASYLEQAQAGTQIFTKMKHNEGFMTLGTASKMSLSDIDRAKFSAVIHKLRNNTKAWMSMGGVVAADLFIGNNDRVDFDYGGIGNAGNMIFQQEMDGSIKRALGYDTLDPTANDAGFMFGRNITAWQDKFGHHLKDVRMYGRKCQQVIAHFNMKSLRPLNLPELLPTDASALAAGMEVGASAMGRKIADRVRMGTKVPSGVMARALYLGWVR